MDRSDRVCILEAHPNAQWNSHRECFVLREQAAEISRIASGGYVFGSVPFRGRVVLQVDYETKVEMFVDVVLGMGFEQFRIAFGQRKPDDDYSSWSMDRAFVTNDDMRDEIELIADAYMGSLLNQEVMIVRAFDGAGHDLRSVYENMRMVAS